MELADRVALVTGGARRVGRALALALAREGAHVAVHYNASRDDAERTAAEIHALGVRVETVQADFARSPDFRSIVDRLHDRFGRLDILVNSASIMERCTLSQIREDDWDRVMAINLKSPFFLSQAAAPRLAENDGGVIINIADLSAFQTWPFHVHHSVSKSGLVHLTRALARALAPAIRVNAIAPGTVLPADDRDVDDEPDASGRRVVPRPGRPDDVAHALRFLIGNEFITGQVVTVDGGRMLL